MKPIFISGCDRSGTTLLASLVGNHPDCIAIPETHFFTDALASYDNGGYDEFQADIFWEIIQNHWRFKIWNLSIPQILEEKILKCNSPVDIMSKLVQAYASSQSNGDVIFWIDHTPSNIGYCKTLFNLFPDSKLIHIVRDGRAVANSVLPLDWGPETVKKAAKWWQEKVAFGIAAEAKYKQKVLRTHYETLVQEPSKTIEDIVSFLELESSIQIETSGFKKPEYTEAQHLLIGGPISKKRAVAWQNEMQDRDIETFEYYTGEFLAYLGYEMHYGIKAQPPNTSNIIDEIRTYIRLKKKSWARKNRIRNSIKEN